ncbi:MAG: hypothetical protein KF689_13100 [Gemmatimonadaceae bacterium]|nr:hypothetical protein [Gemmatimonadaceae bacterium]MCW5827078.1 hypothetical protein [Gemmatimonadaceae bacterium]
MSERRFTDDEVARIFSRATEVQRESSKTLTRNEGMTLAELQAIGQEAGISAELVARAAREVDQPAPPKLPAMLGIPIGVAQDVELGRKLTDDEWEHLVVRLRETFHARGKVETHGSFRQWTNGNLQVLLEPSRSGHRLRFRTLKGETRGFVAAGVSMLAASSIIVLAGSLTGTMQLAEMIASSLPIMLGGVGMTLAGLVRLPRWRRERETQFERLASEMLEITGGD